MTAEIAVMNRAAVALASDSAVTSIAGSRQKIFTSANKLFSLSKHHPVGAMVYGSATIMNVPWETLIKAYRSRLGRKELASLEDYAQGLIRFIDDSTHLFPADIQDGYFKSSVESYFRFVRLDMEKKWQSAIDSRGSVDEREVAHIAAEVIRQHALRWRKAEPAPDTTEDYSQVVLDRFGTFVAEVSGKVFGTLLSAADRKNLRNIAACLASRFPEGLEVGGSSGLVVAGFGKDDYFPVLQSFTVERLVCNKLKYKCDQTKRIGVGTEATIVPFAQHDVVAAFMNGIDPYLRQTELSYLEEVFKKCVERLPSEVKSLTVEQKADMTRRLATVSKEEVDNYRKKLDFLRDQRYVGPVMRVVSMLPKDELAAMAEALVNLTSFKRKVTMDLETVGGPIDVALISKGDGLVWIKRKHYFAPELNPQFLATYYREVHDEDSDKDQ